MHKFTAHQMFLLTSGAVGIVLLVLLYYLISFLFQQPSAIVEMAQGIIVFDGIIFGFQALIFQDQLEDIFSFVKGIKNNVKKPDPNNPMMKQQSVLQVLLTGAFKQSVMHLYVTLIALILILFSSILSFIAVLGSVVALMVSILFTYVSTYMLIVLLLNMVFVRIKTGYDIISRTN